MTTIRAAIYARKSTEQSVADEAKSVARQVELAKAFVKKKGWTVADAHVYVDDGVSGAEFVSRDGLNRLLAAARSTPRPFDAVVMMAVDRLGREQYATASTLHGLIEAGLRVFFYTDGQELKLDSPVAKFMLSAQSFAAEDYRHQIRAKTREAMFAKARAGHVAGGEVYGYLNTCGSCGTPTIPKRSCQCKADIRRAIDETEAAVVRRIFQLAADGLGLLRIVKTLNADGVPSPRHRGARRGWSMSGVREMLRRPLYRGELVYGKTRWTDRGGTKVKLDVPESEWIHVEAPHLRIVPVELWSAAHARMDATRKVFVERAAGRFNGRAAAGLESRFLLSGFLKCMTCGGSVVAFKKMGKRGRPGHYFACNTHRTRGGAVCANHYQVDAAGLTASVVDALKETIRDSPGFIPMLAERARAAGAEREQLVAELATVDAAIARTREKLARFADALLDGDLKTIRRAIEAGEREEADLLARREHLDGQLLAAAATPDVWQGLADLLAGAAKDFAATLTGDLPRARKLLAAVLDGPIALGAVPLRDDETGELTGDVSIEFRAKCRIGEGFRRIMAGTGVVRSVKCPRGDSNTRHAV